MSGVHRSSFSMTVCKDKRRKLSEERETKLRSRWRGGYLGQEACAARDEEALAGVELLHYDVGDACCELDARMGTGMRFRWDVTTGTI